MAGDPANTSPKSTAFAQETTLNASHAEVLANGELRDGENSSSPSPSNQARNPRTPEAKAGFGNFWRILSYSTAADKGLMVCATVFSIGSGAALPLMNVVFGRLVGSFNNYFIPGTNVSRQEFLHDVSQNALYIFYIFIGKFLLSYVSIYSFRMTGIRISATIRMAYLVALFNQPIAAIDRLPPGAATDSLTTVANTIQVAVSDKLGILIQSIALVVSAYVIAFKFSWALTLVSSSVMVFILLIYGVLAPANAGASGVAGEILKSIRTVKSLCAEEAVTARYAKWVAQAKAIGLKKSPVLGAQFAPTFFAIYANFALTFWFGVHQYSAGNIADVRTIVTVLFSVLLVVATLGGIVAPIIAITKAASASTACFKIIDAPQLEKGGLRAPEANAMCDIRFEDVRFTYPSRPRTEILKGMNLTFATGKITALVGPSGCGKSTIVALLERWYHLSDFNEVLPEVEEQNDGQVRSIEEQKAAKKAKKEAKKAEQRGEKNAYEIEQERLDIEVGPVVQNSGRIMVGNLNIDTLDRKWWRSQIGLVQQEPFLFNESIYENVAKGLVGSRWANESEEKKRELVIQACQEAFAHEFIQHLPNGYETLVGEGGIKLSGGQRQRLAIARSIIKRPAILILDEATSSIDVRGERIVEAALDRVSKNRTTITIAHRLSTIKKSDCIIVLADGAAVEEGTHDELIARSDGVYANLVRAQHLEFDDAEVEGDLDLHPASEVGSREVDAIDKDSEGHDSMDESTTSTYKAYGFLKSVGRFLFEQRQHRLIYTFILLGALGGGAAYAVQAWMFSHLIVVFQYTSSRRLVNAGDFWSLMLFVLSLAVAVCYAAIGFSTNSLSVHVSTTYRQQYFESILNKPIPWFDGKDKSSGTLTARLSNDPQQLQEILGPNMALPLIAVFNVTGCTVISFVFGWKLALVTFFAAMPVVLGASFLRIRYEMQFEAFNAKVFAESSQFATESIGAFRTVVALTLEDVISRRYKGLLDEHVRKAFKKGRLAVLVFALSDSLELCSMALAFWYGGQLLGSHEYEVMQFFVIYIALVQGAQAAGQFLGFGPNIAQATAASNRILAFRDGLEVTHKHDNKYLEKPQVVSQERGEGIAIEFRHVGFQYPTRSTPVYKDLSFEIPAGGYVAFVGPSGCGKTTIISLLERFYDCSTGQILIEGVAITELPLVPYRSVCALVSQEPTLFEGSVRENLVLGLSDGIGNEEVEQACRAAEIHDFISALPQSYATPLSSGTHASLSGGQKQRLCIARALLRKPRLLLLDEATSSLDSKSEKLVQKAIDNVAGSGSVTIVVIAHRLATVQNASRIFVLGEGGKILEEGSHSKLVQQRGVYWGMCKAQALDR